VNIYYFFSTFSSHVFFFFGVVSSWKLDWLKYYFDFFRECFFDISPTFFFFCGCIFFTSNVLSDCDIYLSGYLSFFLKTRCFFCCTCLQAATETVPNCTSSFNNKPVKNEEEDVHQHRHGTSMSVTRIPEYCWHRHGCCRTLPISTPAAAAAAAAAAAGGTLCLP
jgi:hypothetical protein